MKKRPQPVVPKKQESNIIHIDPSEIKIRYPWNRPIQWHRNKTIYRRKGKHPNEFED